MARTDSLIALATCLCVKQNTRSCNKNIYSNYRFTGIMSSYGAKITSCSLYSVFLFMQLVFCLAVRQKESRSSWAQHWEDVNSLPSGLFLTCQYWGWFCEKHENDSSVWCKKLWSCTFSFYYSNLPLVLTYFKPTWGTLNDWGTWLYKFSGLTLTHLWYCRNTKSRFHME